MSQIRSVSQEAHLRAGAGQHQEQAIERYLPAPILATVFEYLPQEEENSVRATCKTTLWCRATSKNILARRSMLVLIAIRAIETDIHPEKNLKAATTRMRNPSTEANESRARATLLSSWLGMNSASSSTGTSKYKSWV